MKNLELNGKVLKSSENIADLFSCLEKLEAGYFTAYKNKKELYDFEGIKTDMEGCLLVDLNNNIFNENNKEFKTSTKVYTIN